MYDDQVHRLIGGIPAYKPSGGRALAGWEITGQFAMETDEGKTASINAMSGKNELNLMMAEDEDGTMVIIGVTLK